MNILSCQRDSYLRESESRVLSCLRIGDKEEFCLTLDDSCLYPEGGGQPYDLGSVNDAAVLRVEVASQGLQVVVNKEFDVGEKVVCKVDWDRRYDFMQQHTCQHLLSAVVSILCGSETVKWELGSGSVAVDFEHEGAFTKDEIKLIEENVNAHIRALRRVLYSVVNKDELDSVIDLRGRPKGKALELDDLRLVTIEGLDSNPCGGTHLASTGEIQMFKIVGAETDRGAARLRFLCGNRVFAGFTMCLIREAELCSTLGVGAVDLPQTVDVLYKDRRDASKQIKSLSDELAAMLGASLVTTWRDENAIAIANGAVSRPFIVCNRPNASLAFLQETADSIMTHSESQGLGLRAIYLSGAVMEATGKVSKKGGKGKKGSSTVPSNELDPAGAPLSGPFILYGSRPSDVESMKEAVYAAVQGKGGGRPGKLQGQATALQCMFAIEEIFFTTLVGS
jgi:alanyl-tRNA synthetase